MITLVMILFLGRIKPKKGNKLALLVFVYFISQIIGAFTSSLILDFIYGSMSAKL